MPIRLIAIPSAPIANPLMVEPSAATETTVRPRMARAKYSAGLNARAAFATGPEANIRISTPAIAAATDAPKVDIEKVGADQRQDRHRQERGDHELPAAPVSHPTRNEQQPRH